MKKEKGRRVITATSIYFLLKFGYLGTLNHSKQPCSLFFFFSNNSEPYSSNILWLAESRHLNKIIRSFASGVRISSQILNIMHSQKVKHAYATFMPLHQYKEKKMGLFAFSPTFML